MLKLDFQNDVKVAETMKKIYYRCRKHHTIFFLKYLGLHLIYMNIRVPMNIGCVNFNYYTSFIDHDNKKRTTLTFI